MAKKVLRSAEKFSEPFPTLSVTPLPLCNSRRAPRQHLPTKLGKCEFEKSAAIIHRSSASLIVRKYSKGDFPVLLFLGLFENTKENLKKAKDFSRLANP